MKSLTKCRPKFAVVDRLTDFCKKELRQFTTIQTSRGWQEIWELYYANTWFRAKLDSCVKKVARDSGLPPDCHDDIRQEALTEFARALRRNSSLDSIRPRARS